MCLFDLRTASEEEVSWGLDCFYFLAPSPLGLDLSFLMVASEAHANLLEWADIEKDVQIGAFRVPHIECWHDGPLPVSKIGQILDIRVIPRPIDPNSPAFILAASRRSSRSVDAT